MTFNIGDQDIKMIERLAYEGIKDKPNLQRLCMMEGIYYAK